MQWQRQRQWKDDENSEGTGDSWYERIEDTVGRRLKEKKNIRNSVGQRKQETTNIRRNENKQREVERQRNSDIKHAFLTVKSDHEATYIQPPWTSRPESDEKGKRSPTNEHAAYSTAAVSTRSLAEHETARGKGFSGNDAGDGPPGDHADTDRTATRPIIVCIDGK